MSRFAEPLIMIDQYKSQWSRICFRKEQQRVWLYVSLQRLQMWDIESSIHERYSERHDYLNGTDERSRWAYDGKGSRRRDDSIQCDEYMSVFKSLMPPSNFSKSLAASLVTNFRAHSCRMISKRTWQTRPSRRRKRGRRPLSSKAKPQQNKLGPKFNNSQETFTPDS